MCVHVLQAEGKVEKMQYKNEIQQLARVYQCPFHPDALTRLSEFLTEKNVDAATRHSLLRDLFSLLQKQCVKDRFVNKALIDSVIELQTRKIRGVLDQESSPSVQVVALDAIPRVSIDEISEEFRINAVADGSGRLYALRQRYLLARRRCLRSGIYRGDLSNHVGGDARVPLLPITALEGLSPFTEISVLGVLIRRLDEVYLEDLRGQVKLCLAPNVRLPEHSFVADGFFVVVSGTWSHNVLNVIRVGLPPAEAREKTLSDAGLSKDLYGLAPPDVSAAAEAEKRALQSVIIFLAHLYLDKQSTMNQLAFFFKKMQERSEAELGDTTFVLIGDFSSTPLNYGDASHLPNASDGTEEFRVLLDTLGTCISTNAPTAAQQSHFILIPGPRDITALQGFQPQPPLTNHFTKGLKGRLKRVTLAPNPCRLRFFTHEVVVARRDFFRDFAEGVRKLGWGAPQSEQEAQGSFERISKTVLDEAHLAPDMRGAVLWKMDDALQLSVLPHTLLLCDSTEQWEYDYKGVHVVNPGSFAVTGTFLWYTPADGECSLSNV